MQQQVREAGGEVGDKVVRDGAKSLLNLSGQLSVMVPLVSHRTEQVSDRAAFVGAKLPQVCLQRNSDVFPPVALDDGPPSSLELSDNRAVQRFLFYSVAHILKELQLLLQAPEERMFENTLG